MHDPMVVAFEIHAPIPKRERWREKTDAKRLGRWGLHRRRRTNPENLGEPVYPWWRPAGCTVRAAGRTYGLRNVATIWHVEPHGRDSGEVCKHYYRWQDDAGEWHGKPLQAWRWHIHHWRIQIIVVRKLHRFLFERCTHCGHRYPWGYAPVAHQWDEPRGLWFKVTRRAYHHECSSLVMLRRDRAVDEEVIRHLFVELAGSRDQDEIEALAQVTDAKQVGGMEFRLAYRLERLLGYERGDRYELVKKGQRQ